MPKPRPTNNSTVTAIPALAPEDKPLADFPVKQEIDSMGKIKNHLPNRGEA